MTFRTRTFLTVFLSATLALAVSTALVERSIRTYMYEDARTGLLNQARLAASLLSHSVSLPDPDAEADALGRLTGARVTFIAGDGRVLGDSDVDAAGLSGLEDHLTREEVIAARAVGEGTGVRRSHTTAVETMYAAVAVPEGPVAYARVALPLTAIAERVARLRHLALIGLGAGLVAAAFMTGLASMLLNRRIEAVAETARRYRAGDFSRPTHDHGRDEIGVVANTLDETAHALGAQLAEMSRERAHTDAILTGMVEGVVLVNASGRLVLTNPAVRAMLRLPDDLTDHHYLEVVRQPDISRQLAAALAGQTTTPVEVQLERDARRIFVANVVPVARERDGGAVLVLHDITDLRHADQVRRDFVANVSHELRTPLTAIRGYVEALSDDPPEPEVARRFLGVIARHTLRMDRLVRDLLRLARLDAGQEVLERTAVPMRTVIANIVEHDLAPLLGERRLRVMIAIDEGADTVVGDPAKLHDVFRNLLENAAHYSPEGATIEVQGARTGGTYEISVADRGPGIPVDDLSRIFERFYRVDRSRTRDPGGTGLGLSIVKHLVELHGGHVRATNRSDGGAMLTVSLPARDRS